MKLALLTYSTKPRGGVVHTLALAEALAASGQDVHVWTLARGGDQTFFRAVEPAVTVHAVPFPELAGEDVGPRVTRSIETLRAALAPARAAYDVVHAQDCISANAALPCVRTIHHLDTFTTPQLAACHERAVVEPRARICLSEAVAAEVRRGWGLRPTVIASGVDAARFAVAVDDHVRRTSWAARLGDYVLAVGGVEPRKGSIDLLEAFAALDRPDLSLVFAGGETLFDYRSYREDFDRRASELGVRPVVLGPVDDDELPALVAQARLLSFVSTKEGFGLAALEALAAGVPVLARDLPVLREVYGSSVTYASDLQSMARGLGQLLDQPPDPQAGRDLAASYTWEAAAARHLEFYASLAPA